MTRQIIAILFAIALLFSTFTGFAQFSAAQLRNISTIVLKGQMTEKVQIETTNFFNELTNGAIKLPLNPRVIIVSKSFTNAPPEGIASCDYGDFPTNVTFLVTNKFADRLLDPEATRFYFSGGDLDGYLGKPFKLCYLWDGKVHGEYITLFYINAKNSYGAYVGKKLYGIRTYSKDGESTYSCSRCECFINAIGTEGKKNVFIICYPEDFSDQLIKDFDFGGGTGSREIDITKEAWPWKTIRQSMYR